MSKRREGPERRCVRCSRKHTYPRPLCRECNNAAILRYRAGDRNARQNNLRRARGGAMDGWKPSTPPEAPPGFNPADLTTARPE